MTIRELQEILLLEHVREDAYDLNGGHRPEAYTLRQEDDSKWYVYYSEKGRESGRREFPTESQACEYLLARLRSDPNTRE